MELTLPERLYLLSYDLDKDRLDSVSSLYRDQLLRAAALAQLTIGGVLGVRKRKAVRAGGPAPRDPFLARVLDDVPAHKPRSWTDVLLRGPGTAEKTVRDRLADAGAITVEKSRLLGLLPVRKVTPGDPDQVRGLRERVRHTVTSGLDPASAPLEDTAVAAIAAEGDVESVFTWREKRAHKREVTALKSHFDATFPGLRDAVLTAVVHSRSTG